MTEFQLSVRKHTPESRAVWKQKIFDTLPNDIPVDDREQIAEELISSAERMGAELRRKRLKDHLQMAISTIQALIDRDEGPDADQMSDWWTLMLEAHDEIEGIDQ